MHKEKEQEQFTFEIKRKKNYNYIFCSTKAMKTLEIQEYNKEATSNC